MKTKHFNYWGLSIIWVLILSCSTTKNFPEETLAVSQLLLTPKSDSQCIICIEEEK